VEKMILNGNDPNICGLVLAGGKSTRMGTDKSVIEWHGKQQRFHMADMLQVFFDEVYISCRAEQQTEILGNGYEAMPDSFEGMGPYGAILSAFKFNPNSAWLIVACDLPLISEEVLRYLIEMRNPDKVATTFRSPFDNLPEPLITIWEPRSHKILLSRMEEGKTCPRKALLNSDVKVIEPPDGDALFNANTPEDLKRVKKILAWPPYERGLEKI
jgi:molybdopterin-guanine dinucleotide biosynthesis protein A